MRKVDDAGAVMIRTRHFKTSNDQINVGDFVYAHVDISGKLSDLPAEVLDVRVNEFDDGTKETQYYVHYEDRDRRLDEWIPLNRILKTIPVQSKNIKTPAAKKDMLPMTRSQRRIQEEFGHMHVGINTMDATTAKLEKQHEERTKIKNVQRVVIGRYDVDVWYYSPYPPTVVDGFVESLYICEYCLFYYTDFHKYKKHINCVCKRRQPPGHVIYRDKHLEVYEVFGNVYKLYCQCLCLLSKLFLDHKTLYYEVENFRFYVLCEVDEQGSHIVGHFSKEYNTNNNLACIMVLPPYQRNGYGKLLIQLSYAISKKEKRIGTPEKPLSDLGKVSYRSYWWWILMRCLDRINQDGPISVQQLSYHSGIHADDIIATFKAVQMIKFQKNSTDQVVICNRSIIDFCKTLQFFKAPKLMLIDENLRWSADQELVPVLKEKELIKKIKHEDTSDVDVDVIGLQESPPKKPSTSMKPPNMKEKKNHR